MDTAEAGKQSAHGRLKERFAAFETKKKAFFCDVSRKLVRGIVKRHEKSLELLGDHKEHKE